MVLRIISNNFNGSAFTRSISHERTVQELLEPTERVIMELRLFGIVSKTKCGDRMEKQIISDYNTITFQNEPYNCYYLTNLNKHL